MKLAIVTDGVDRLLSLTPETIEEAFELGRKYATESGHELTDIKIDLMKPYPVSATVKGEAFDWFLNGHRYIQQRSSNDLVEIPDPPLFDVTAQWMRRGDGRRPEKVELQFSGRVRYLVDGCWVCVDENGFRRVRADQQPDFDDLIPYVAPKARSWTRADVPDDCEWARSSPCTVRRVTEIQDNGLGLGSHWYCWDSLAASWEWSPTRNGPWKRFEVSE